MFLRKERGDLKLARIKLEESELENEATKVTIKNKVSAIQQELTSFLTQSDYITSIVRDYETLVKAAEILNKI